MSVARSVGGKNAKQANDCVNSAVIVNDNEVNILSNKMELLKREGQTNLSVFCELESLLFFVYTFQ